MTHVAGSQFEEKIHRQSRRVEPAETLGLGLRGLEGLHPVQALDGGLVLSDHRMDLFRRWLSDAVAARPEVRAINLSTRGSVVAGLLLAPPNYGESWAPVELFLGGLDFTPGKSRSGEPPFDQLRSAMALSDRRAAAADFRVRAEAFWGPSTWQSWAGRAWQTWERWPSARSWRAVNEVMELTLQWERFWKKAEEFSKSDSRIGDPNR